jgi:hypothetical protein
VSRKCSSEERDSLREAFNRGEIDVMLLSPVCKQSYDLLDCSAIILLEVPDSQGAEGQIVSRILRSAAVRKRPDMVVKLIRMMAVFPTEDPVRRGNMCCARLQAIWPISPFHPASYVVGCSSSPDTKGEYTWNNSLRTLGYQLSWEGGKKGERVQAQATHLEGELVRETDD